MQRIPSRSGEAGHPRAVWLIAGVLLLCLIVACSGVFLWSNGTFDWVARSDAPTPSATPVTARFVLPPTEGVPSPTRSQAPSPAATRALTATPTTPPTATSTRPPTATATPFRYKIRAGDSLISIAAKYKITVQDLMRANGLTNDLIRVGDELIIPRPTPTPNR